MQGAGAVSATDLVRRCTMGANAGSVPLCTLGHICLGQGQIAYSEAKIVWKKLGSEGRKRNVRESPAQNREKEL